jgi:hypothetical protein
LPFSGPERSEPGWQAEDACRNRICIKKTEAKAMTEKMLQLADIKKQAQEAMDQFNTLWRRL